jgi:hypothetical protein
MLKLEAVVGCGSDAVVVAEYYVLIGKFTKQINTHRL